MKKLFKLLSLLSLLRELRGHGRYGHSRYGYRRSRSHYPLYHRRGFRGAIAERLLGRLLHGRRY